MKSIFKTIVILVLSVLLLLSSPQAFARIIPAPEDVDQLMSCGTYQGFNDNSLGDFPSTPQSPLAFLLRSIPFISEAQAAGGQNKPPEDIRDFNEKQIQRMLTMPSAEAIANLGETIDIGRFGAGTPTARKLQGELTQVSQFLNNTLNKMKGGSGSSASNIGPRLVWAYDMSRSAEGRYDPGSNTIYINVDIPDRKYTLSYIYSIVAHEYGHFIDVVLNGKEISIAATEAYAHLLGDFAYYYTEDTSKKVSINPPPSVTPPYSPALTALASDSVLGVQAKPPLGKTTAFFHDQRFLISLHKLSDDQQTWVKQECETAFQLDELYPNNLDPKYDVGIYVTRNSFLSRETEPGHFENVPPVGESSIIDKISWWDMRVDVATPKPQDAGNNSNVGVLTGTTGSRTGWPVPIDPKSTLGNPKNVNAAMIEVFNIPDGFSIEVQGVRWPDMSTNINLGTELFRKGNDGKYYGNLGGEYDNLVEAGTYLVKVKGGVLDLDPSRPFDPNEKPPDPKKYILPNSQWDLKKNDCGEDEDGRKALDYSCFRSCQKELEYKKKDEHRSVWNSCVGQPIPVHWAHDCESTRTNCGNYINNGIPGSLRVISCNASEIEMNCNNRDYYGEGPIKAPDDSFAYGTATIDPSSGKLKLYFHASGSVEGLSDMDEAYTLKSDETWEGSLGGKIPLGPDGKSQKMPTEPTIAIWGPDPNDPNKFIIQYSDSITKTLVDDHPLPGYTDPKDDPKCNMPVYGPGSYACKMQPSNCVCTCSHYCTDDYGEKNIKCDGDEDSCPTE